MNKATIISIWVVVLLVVDCVSFFVPIGSFLLFIVVLLKPKWFYDAVQAVYKQP